MDGFTPDFSPILIIFFINFKLPKFTFSFVFFSLHSFILLSIILKLGICSINSLNVNNGTVVFKLLVLIFVCFLTKNIGSYKLSLQYNNKVFFSGSKSSNKGHTIFTLFLDLLVACSNINKFIPFSSLLNVYLLTKSQTY